MRTQNGIILEKILHNLKHRYLLCWNGEPEGAAYDCACCLTYFTEDTLRCKCICHQRIKEMASSPMLTLWLMGLEKFDILPFIPSSYKEQMAHDRKLTEEHEEFRKQHPRIDWDCNCEACEHVRKQDKRALADPEDCRCGICEEFKEYYGEGAEKEEVPDDREVEMYTSPVPGAVSLPPKKRVGDLVTNEQGAPVGVVVVGTVHDEVDVITTYNPYEDCQHGKSRFCCDECLTSKTKPIQKAETANLITPKQTPTFCTECGGATNYAAVNMGRGQCRCLDLDDKEPTQEEVDELVHQVMDDPEPEPDPCPNCRKRRPEECAFCGDNPKLKVQRRKHL